MPVDDYVVLCITRAELGMITDALDLMHDCEHLRPERQEEIAEFSTRIEKMLALFDFAGRELGR
jgi:hypothetical protein